MSHADQHTVSGRTSFVVGDLQCDSVFARFSICLVYVTLGLASIGLKRPIPI